MKKYLILNNFLKLINLKINITRIKKNNNFKNIFSDNPKKDCKILNLNKISLLSDNIEGMISSRAGEELFGLAYMQKLQGDVIEVGSFQGKSTMFLGMAVKYSGNGHLYAIDHFKGNKGKEKEYIINQPDLSDLKVNFLKNIFKANLKNFCTLIDKPNDIAIKKIKNKSCRLLFVDGDHSKEGVKKDIKLFLPKLKRNAIIIFDDYDPHNFSGLVDVVNNFIQKKKNYQIGRFLVVQI
jgi:hypothetical protein